MLRTIHRALCLKNGLKHKAHEGKATENTEGVKFTSKVLHLKNIAEPRRPQPDKPNKANFLDRTETADLADMSGICDKVWCAGYLMNGGCNDGFE